MYTLDDYLITTPSVPPAIRSYASAYGNTGNKPTLTLPGDVTDGDMIVVFIGSNYGVSSPPSGYITLVLQAGSYHSTYMGYKIASSDAEAALQATCSGSQPWAFWAVVVKNAGEPRGYNGARATSGTSLTTGAADSKKGDLLLSFCSVRASGATLTSSIGNKVSERTADDSLSSAFFSAISDAAIVSDIITSDKSTQGFGVDIVSITGR
jgi:hypothetical protein